MRGWEKKKSALPQMKNSKRNSRKKEGLVTEVKQNGRGWGLRPATAVKNSVRKQIGRSPGQPTYYIPSSGKPAGLLWHCKNNRRLTEILIRASDRNLIRIASKSRDQRFWITQNSLISGSFCSKVFGQGWACCLKSECPNFITKSWLPQKICQLSASSSSSLADFVCTPRRPSSSLLAI